MVTVGLVGAGAMGSALGECWLAGGSRVVTCLAGRGGRTRALVAGAGLTTVARPEEVVADSDIVASIVPPGAAVSAARSIAAWARRTGTAPLVVDFNAVAPPTVERIGRLLAGAGCDLVDASVSGPPPRPGAPAVRVYLCGPRAGELADLAGPGLDLVRLGGPVGSASALKMCTASMYKGTKALVMHALLTADAFGVRDEFLADTARAWPADVPGWHLDVAQAATKAWRFVEEMREIAATQRAAGLPPELFEGMAAAYDRAAHTALGRADPESLDPSASVDEVLDRLTTGRRGIQADPRREQIVTEGSTRETSTPPAAATVGDVMRPPLTTVERDAHVAAAAYLMKRANATALVVLDDDLAKRPIGLITEADIVHAVADGKDPSQVRIHDLMTVDPTVIKATTSIREAAESMLDRRFRHLPVVGDAGLVGMVELADVCRALL